MGARQISVAMASNQLQLVLHDIRDLTSINDVFLDASQRQYACDPFKTCPACARGWSTWIGPDLEELPAARCSPTPEDASVAKFGTCRAYAPAPGSIDFEGRRKTCRLGAEHITPDHRPSMLWAPTSDLLPWRRTIILRGC